MSSPSAADASALGGAMRRGDEPARITDESQYLDVDAVILQMADNIHRARAEREAKLKPRKRRKSFLEIGRKR